MANTTNLDLVKPLGTDHALVAQINSNSDKIDAEAGRTRANFAEEYSPSSPYAVGAFCTHAGIFYQCNTAIGSGGEAWTAGHWTQVPVGDAIVANTQAIATLNSNLNSKFKTDTASGTTDSNGNIKVSTSIRHIFFAMYAGYCLIPFVYAGETYLKAVGTGGSTLTVAANLNINLTYYYIDG